MARIARLFSSQVVAAVVALLLGGAWASPPAALGHRLYLANDNHTDYGWNATTQVYDAAMLSELDFYLGQIAATAGNPPAEQGRFNTDGWFYLYLYEHTRSVAQFQKLIDAMKSGHITIPLNPFITLYGALPTDAAVRPGLVAQGGNFLPGTRADLMTLNHFVSFAANHYNITLSNWDAYAMRVGSSTATAFQLPTSNISVLALGNPSWSDIDDQGGDAYFLNRFALSGTSGDFSASQSMMTSLAHQNPLRAIPLPRNHAGPLAAATASFLSVSAPNVVVTAFKPAEEGERGLVVRLWELDGTPTSFSIDASAFAPVSAYEVSLIETDAAAVALQSGAISASIGAHEMKAYRFVAGAATPTATPTRSATAVPIATATLKPSATPTRQASATASPVVVASATPTPAVTATPGVRPGDVNGDGQVALDDLRALLAALFQSSPPPAADVQADSRVTAADVTALVRLLPAP